MLLNILFVFKLINFLNKKFLWEYCKALTTITVQFIIHFFRYFEIFFLLFEINYNFYSSILNQIARFITLVKRYKRDIYFLNEYGKTLLNSLRDKIFFFNFIFIIFF